MSNVIPFPVANKSNLYPPDWPYTVAGVPVNPPTTGREFLELCKQFLEPEDYTDLLVAIMDEDAYNGVEQELRTLANHYYEFLRKRNS